MPHARHCIMLSVTVLVLAAAACRAATPDDLFADARLAPRDVTLYLHIADAGSLWSELADRPIAGFVSELLGRGDLAEAWERLAHETNQSPQTLFNSLLGQQVTVMLRGDGAAAQWALISRADLTAVDRVLQALEPRVLAPRHDVALSEVPEFGVVVGRRQGMLLVGPIGSMSLLEELLPALRTQHETPLADEPAIAEARDLGEGQLGIFLRHEAPLGGHSIAVADFRGEKLTVHHAAKFDHAPFSTPVTKLTWDFSPLHAFEQHSIIALMEPTDTGGGQVEHYCMAALGEGLISADMRKNIGQRRLLVMGSADKRVGGSAVPALAGARCYEIEGDISAIAELDHQMIRLTEAINRAGQGAYLVNVPEISAFRQGAARQIDLQAAADVAFQGLPVMADVELNWDVASGPSGRWYVIASDREQLLRCKQALAAPAPQSTPAGTYEQCGYLNGQKLGMHLRSWSDIAKGFAGDGPEQEEVQQLCAALHLFAELTGGIQKCCWQLSRPAEDQVRLNVQIKLVEPQSTRAPQLDSRIERKRTPAPIQN